MRFTPAGFWTISAKFARELSQYPILTVALRRGLLSYGGLQIDRDADIADRVRVTRGQVTIGKGATIGRHVYLGDETHITIGPGAAIAAHCKIETATHDVGPATRRAGPERSRPVVIGKGVWLGIGVTVLPGVIVGDGCVIAAGSVVTETCAPHGLYAGVPAVRKRELERPAEVTPRPYEHTQALQPVI